MAEVCVHLSWVYTAITPTLPMNMVLAEAQHTTHSPELLILWVL